VPNLLTAAKRGFDRKDHELPALSLYGWAMQHLDHEPDEWDEEAIHVSDYRYILEPEEGGCERQLWHRLRQDEASDRTLWERMMFDQGFALQIRFSWLLCQGLPKEWGLEAVEIDLSEGLPAGDVGSCDLVLASDTDLLAVEIKTQRGRAFKYLDEPKPSHVLQSQGEAYALKRIYPERDLNHRIVYLDREGQNTPLVFPTDTGEEAEERVLEASSYVNQIKGTLDHDPPDPLSPIIEVRENKGPNSIYLKEPWMCEYCLTPDTKVVTSDLRWVEIGDVGSGDQLLAFDEDAPSGNRMRRDWQIADVNHARRIKRQCFEIYFANGDTITASANHLWLAKKFSKQGGGRYEWVRTIDLVKMKRVDSRPFAVCKVLEPWNVLDSRLSGYLAATLDGEGSVRQYADEESNTEGIDINFSQLDNRMLEIATTYLDALGFEYGKAHMHDGVYRVRLEGPKADRLRFLGSVRPPMKLANFSIYSIGCMQAIEQVVVDSIEPAGKQEVVALDTSTSTLVAEGYASHNCDFKGTSCPGALEPDLTEHGIVAKGDHEDLGSLDWKVDGGLKDRIEIEIARAVQSNNVKTK
jgi:hypothetical protein